MNSDSPITPPPELVRQWLSEYFGTTVTGEVSTVEQHIATQAARWAADAELEACMEWLQHQWKLKTHVELIPSLRSSRRPKPPSLKEQALETLRQIPIDPEAGVSSVKLDTIRRALESLPD